jgi:rubrerythrin
MPRRRNEHLEGGFKITLKIIPCGYSLVLAIIAILLKQRESIGFISCHGLGILERGRNMTIEDTFGLAIQLEAKMSECYKEIAQVCQDQSISKELTKLSNDEVAHMNLLIMGKNYLREAPDMFSLESERTTESKTALNGIIKLIESVRNKNTTLRQAINDAAELEKLFEQFHLRTIAEVKDASLKRLFEALSTDDTVHTERLIKIITSFSSSS